jgi:hypothetical protein
MSIVVDSEYNLFGITPARAGHVFGGDWETHTNGGVITGALVRLANDYHDEAPYLPYETVAVEEIAQSMGAGFCQTEYPFNTLHTGFNYYNKSATMSAKDKDILRLVYSDYVHPGDAHYAVAKALNIPGGVYAYAGQPTLIERTIGDSFLDRGVNYKVRAFMAGVDGNISEATDWIDVFVPVEDRPDSFGWTYAKTQGGGFNLTADEWNAYTKRMNAFQAYFMNRDYAFTPAVKGEPFTAAMYNQVKDAMRRISLTAPERIPSVSAGDDITADMMNVIVDELNAVS